MFRFGILRSLASIDFVWSGGGLVMGSGSRVMVSGDLGGRMMGSGGRVIGSVDLGGRLMGSGDCGGRVMGSGGRGGRVMGSGGRVMSSGDRGGRVMGSGGRVMSSGGRGGRVMGSGDRGGRVMGSGDRGGRVMGSGDCGGRVMGSGGCGGRVMGSGDLGGSVMSSGDRGGCVMGSGGRGGRVMGSGGCGGRVMGSVDLGGCVRRSGGHVMGLGDLGGRLVGLGGRVMGFGGVENRGGFGGLFDCSYSTTSFLSLVGPPEGLVDCGLRPEKVKQKRGRPIDGLVDCGYSGPPKEKKKSGPKFPWRTCRVEPPEFDFLQDPKYAPKTQKLVVYVFLFWDLDSIGVGKGWAPLREFIECLREMYECELKIKYGVDVEVVFKIMAAGVTDSAGDRGVFGKKDGNAIFSELDVEVYDADDEPDGADKYLCWGWEKAYGYCIENNMYFHALLLSRDRYYAQLFNDPHNYLPHHLIVSRCFDTSSKYARFGYFGFSDLFRESIERYEQRRQRLAELNAMPNEGCYLLVKGLPCGTTTDDIAAAFGDFCLHSIRTFPDSGAIVAVANEEVMQQIGKAWFWLKKQQSLNVVQRHGFFIVSKIPAGTSLRRIKAAFSGVDLRFVKLLRNEHALVVPRNVEAKSKIERGKFFLPLDVSVMNRRTDIFLKVNLEGSEDLEELVSKFLPAIKFFEVKVTALHANATIGFYNHDAAQYSLVRLLDKKSEVRKAIKSVFCSVSFNKLKTNDD